MSAYRNKNPISIYIFPWKNPFFMQNNRNPKIKYFKTQF